MTSRPLGGCRIAVLMLHHCTLVLALFLSAVAPAQTQQTPAPDEAAQPASKAGGQQPLELSEAVARDVLEPLQAGVQTRNFKQALAVFDAESFPDFAQFRDRLRAFLDSYPVLQFRYKILQANAQETGWASVICEADLDATPADDGQVPVRRSIQLRLQLKQTPEGWRISGLSPSDFFAP